MQSYVFIKFGQAKMQVSIESSFENFKSQISKSLGIKDFYLSYSPDEDPASNIFKRIENDLEYKEALEIITKLNRPIRVDSSVDSDSDSENPEDISDLSDDAVLILDNTKVLLHPRQDQTAFEVALQFPQISILPSNQISFKQANFQCICSNCALVPRDLIYECTSCFNYFLCRSCYKKKNHSHKFSFVSLHPEKRKKALVSKLSEQGFDLSSIESQLELNNFDYKSTLKSLLLIQ